MVNTLEDKLNKQGTSWENLPWHKKTFHPNRISAYSVPLVAAGVSLVVGTEYDVVGISLYASGSLLDLVDGYLSRKWDMQTVEGSKLDPAVDKARFLITGGTIIASKFAEADYLSPVIIPILANVAYDFKSQKQRWKATNAKFKDVINETYNAVIHPERCSVDLEKNTSLPANYFGKVKTWTQAIAAGFCIGDSILQMSQEFQTYADWTYATAFITSAILGAIGTKKRNGKIKSYTSSKN